VKTIQGLSKRKGAIAFVRPGGKGDFGPMNVGDFAHVVHQNGGNAVIRVDIVQIGGTFIGTVVRCFPKIGGVEIGDVVRENADVVFTLIREDGAVAPG
jgi:hypothetical protein